MASRRSLAVFILSLICLMSLPATAEVIPGTASAADAINDPWLSEEGPAIAEPVDEAEEQVAAAWRAAPPAAYARAAALRRVRLELGVDDLLTPARVILKEASDGDPKIYTEFARDLAPGAPAIQLAHAQALSASGDIGAATKSFGAAMWTIAAGLPAQLWLLENFTFILWIVVIAASLSFILLSALQTFPHAAHDLGDLIAGSRTPAFVRSAALAAFILIPLALGEGVIGLALTLFIVAFAYGQARQRNVLVMAAVLLVIALHPLAQLVSIATTLVDRDPVVRSVMDVVAGVGTRADVELLESVAGQDVAAAHALVYRARRNGLEEESRTRLEALSERVPEDGYVLTALGNIEMRRGRADVAIGLYERASAEVDSPTLLFNLSQAYASVFRMEEYEGTLVRAQAMDSDVVAALSSLDDASLVADLPYPFRMLQERLAAIALSEEGQLDLAIVLAPGRIGEHWGVTAGAFVLAALLCLLFANRFDHGSQCDRCGHRICKRCQETVWSEEICEDCHHLFRSSAATDPSLRMARLQALARRELRIDRLLLAGSLLIPGVAGLVARRPDFAMFGLLLFGWIAAWVAWPAGVFEDPLLLGDAGILCFAIAGVLSVVAYSGIVLASLVARKKI